MAPKKAPTAAPVKAKVDQPLGGLNVEACPLPLWDDAEAEKEQWGDLAATHVDASLLFVDHELPVPIVSTFTTVTGLEWRRPSAVFSPFKPVVFRPTLQGNPYEFTVTNAGLTSGNNSVNNTSISNAAEDDDEEGNPKPQSRAEMVALHRSMKVFRSGGADDDPASTTSVRRAHSTTTKRRDRAIAPTPFFMKAFNSALMVLNQAQTLLPPGSYAWELIYPQTPGTHVPTYNPTGKYWVKLFFAGAFRRVVIDDRLPTDAFGQCILTVTDSKEIWPALLAKAILKALGPQHESLLFTSPTVAVQTLMCGWLPQYINPRKEEALAFKTVRVAMEQMKSFKEALHAKDIAVSGISVGNSVAGSAPPTPHQRPHGALLVATCNDTSIPQLPASVAEEHAAAAGLQCNQAFYVMEMRPHQNTNLLRMCSPGAAWKGSYGYDTNAWTTEFETTLGFHPAKDRNSADISRKWNDFWIPWDSFVKFFNTLVVLRDSTAKECSAFKQIAYTDAPSGGAAAADTPAAAPPAKGAKAAPAPSAHATITSDGKPKSITKWVCFNADAPSHAIVAISGLPQRPPKVEHESQPASPTPEAAHSGHAPLTPLTPGTAGASTTSAVESAPRLTTTVVVHSYTWNNTDPFIQVLHLSATDGLTTSAPLLVPTGQRAFRVTATNLYQGMIVSVLGSSEFQMGDQKDICRDLMGVHSTVDAGIYGEHQPDTPTIWFKRFFTVKQPAMANFVVGTLPKGTDLSLHRMVPVEPAGGKNAKAEKPKPPPKKGAEPVATEPATDNIDDGHHDRPIIDFVRLSVIDLDTGKATQDTVGKIMHMGLQPNKLGYIVIARATTPEKYGRGYWRLTCTSDKPLEQFEPRNFEETQSRQGVYTPNDADSLFRFLVTTGEPATTTIQLALKDGADVPVTLTLYHNDKLVEQREAKGGAQIDHATLTPPDKAVPSTYAVQCVVNKAFLAQWEAARRESAIAAFRADTAEQTARLLKRQAQLRQLLQADPNAKLPHDDTLAASESHATQVASLGFVLSFHSSTAKLDVKEDASINEATTAVKLSWSKKDEAAAAPAKGAKAPAKGHNPAADDAASRFAKAKESRDRFLANREGVFMPYVNATTNKAVLYPSDEDHLGYRQAPAQHPLPHDATSRIHLGFTLNGANLHGGTASSSAALRPAHPPVAKPAIKENVEKLQTELIPQVRDAKKHAFAEVTEIMNAFFAEIKPNQAAPEPSEEDKKKNAKQGKK